MQQSVNINTIYNNIINYCNARRSLGFKVAVCTILPRTGGTPPVGFEENRLALNALIRSGFTGFADGLVDLAYSSNLSTTTDTTYFNVDQIHLTNAGYNIVANLVYQVIKDW